ncbi:hypothetical protein [uncultured Clostridium sp.]|uniref:hypothetical protein n=1 Tax=uncultured Clostridium sp. TaxID=59620 RepID=UPI0027DB4D5B|nr:hypothetical protein [uncultured Clostridium sp.]
MDFHRVSEDQREKLYNEVWKEKVPVVAQRYGVAEATLRKHCRNLWIPLPVPGYWAKIQSGKKVEWIDLPKVRGELKKYVYNYVIKYRLDIDELEDEELIGAKELNLLRDDTVESIIEVCSNIKVGKQLRDPDKLIIEHKEEVVYRRKRDRELKGATFNSDYYRMIRNKYRNNNAILNIDVSDDKIRRAYIIIDTLIKSLDELEGFTRVMIDDNRDISYFIIMQSAFYFEVKEEKNNLALSMVTKGWFGEGKERRLIFKDNGNKLLEEQIGDIIYQMFVIANKLLGESKLNERELQRKIEAREKQCELEEKRVKELENLKSIEEMSSNWERAKKIRSFVEAMKNKLREECNQEKKEKLKKIIEWALDRADCVDPLIDNDGKIFGKWDTIFKD